MTALQERIPKSPDERFVRVGSVKYRRIKRSEIKPEFRCLFERIVRMEIDPVFVAGSVVGAIGATAGHIISDATESALKKRKERRQAEQGQDDKK